MTRTNFRRMALASAAALLVVGIALSRPTLRSLTREASVLRPARRAPRSNPQPRELPEWLRRASAPATDLVVAFVRRKCGVSASTLANAEASLVRELDGLRAALAGGRAYLLGDALTYADIAMAVTLQFVAPVDAKYIPIGPALRRAREHSALAERYGDLVAWRDALYGNHRSR